MKINIVICGDIRDQFDLIQLLKKITSFKHIVNEVIVSTWQDCINQHKNLIDVLSKSGIKFVGLTPLDDGGVGNIIRQKKQLCEGLLSIENKNLPVLKIRTDKCIDILDSFFKYCETRTSLEKSFDNIFRNKIVVQMISVGTPFLIADKVFLGTWSDLYKLTLSVDYFDKESVFGKKLGAESRWFLSPFLYKYEFFRFYFNEINFRSISTKLVEDISHGSLPDYLRYYLHIIYKNFSLPIVGDNIYLGINAIKNGIASNMILIEKRGAWSDMHLRAQSILDSFAKFEEINFDWFNKNPLNRFASLHNKNIKILNPKQKELANINFKLVDYLQISNYAKAKYSEELNQILSNFENPVDVYMQIYKLLEKDNSPDLRLSKYSILKRMVKEKKLDFAVTLYEFLLADKNFADRDVVMHECRNLVKSRTGKEIESFL